mmetsp:Transcript_13109/g.55090  ORF Transcript_13109/g.55090 Transcript_13109/m.55090 type:complete len:100 (+) Transcript_13109:123-422(+)
MLMAKKFCLKQKMHTGSPQGAKWTDGRLTTKGKLGCRGFRGRGTAVGGRCDRARARWAVGTGASTVSPRVPRFPAPRPGPALVRRASFRRVPRPISLAR